MLDKNRHAAESQFALRVLSAYTRLIPPDSEVADLGGKLLFAGLLDEEARAQIVAASIAGAATLCATPSEQEQKQAVHDGIVDFLVTSLDEALRILKNELRRHAPVAVCIGASSEDVKAQMAERGVEPDLLRLAEGEGSDTPAPADMALVSWSVSLLPARWMPKLDAYALECAEGLSEGARRWLRLSPRYLGRLSRSVHLVLADRTFATQFMEGAVGLEDGKIPMKLQVSYRGGAEEINAPGWDKE